MCTSRDTHRLRFDAAPQTDARRPVVPADACGRNGSFHDDRGRLLGLSVRSPFRCAHHGGTVIGVRRGFVFCIGAAIFGTGVWLIATEHSREAACKAATGVLPGISSSCQAIGWNYFAGFVAAAVGLIVVLFTGLMKQHELRYRGHPDRPTEFSLREIGLKRPGDPGAPDAPLSRTPAPLVNDPG
jgi:hypothetical protein